MAESAQEHMRDLTAMALDYAKINKDKKTDSSGVQVDDKTRVCPQYYMIAVLYKAGTDIKVGFRLYDMLLDTCADYTIESVCQRLKEGSVSIYNLAWTIPPRGVSVPILLFDNVVCGIENADALVSVVAPHLELVCTEGDFEDYTRLDENGNPLDERRPLVLCYIKPMTEEERFSPRMRGHLDGFYWDAECFLLDYLGKVIFHPFNPLSVGGVPYNPSDTKRTDVELAGFFARFASNGVANMCMTFSKYSLFLSTYRSAFALFPNVWSKYKDTESSIWRKLLPTGKRRRAEVMSVQSQTLRGASAEMLQTLGTVDYLPELSIAESKKHSTTDLLAHLDSICHFERYDNTCHASSQCQYPTHLIPKRYALYAFYRRDKGTVEIVGSYDVRLLNLPFNAHDFSVSQKTNSKLTEYDILRSPVFLSSDGRTENLSKDTLDYRSYWAESEETTGTYDMKALRDKTSLRNVITMMIFECDSDKRSEFQYRRCPYYLWYDNMEAVTEVDNSTGVVEVVHTYPERPYFNIPEQPVLNRAIKPLFMEKFKQMADAAEFRMKSMYAGGAVNSLAPDYSSGDFEIRGKIVDDTPINPVIVQNLCTPSVYVYISNGTTTPKTIGVLLSNGKSCLVSLSSYGDIRYKVIEEDSTSVSSLTLGDRNRSLTEIRIYGDAETYPWFMFYHFRGLKSVQLGEKSRIISDGMFYGCSSLVNIELPASVRHIGWRAFCKCESLLEIVIPDGVKEISAEAFIYCTALKRVVLPASCEYIHDSAFAGCASLEVVEVNNPNMRIHANTFTDCPGAVTEAMSRYIAVADAI